MPNGSLNLLECDPYLDKLLSGVPPNRDPRLLLGLPTDSSSDKVYTGLLSLLKDAGIGTDLTLPSVKGDPVSVELDLDIGDVGVSCSLCTDCVVT